MRIFSAARLGMIPGMISTSQFSKTHPLSKLHLCRRYHAAMRAGFGI